MQNPPRTLRNRLFPASVFIFLIAFNVEIHGVYSQDSTKTTAPSAVQSAMPSAMPSAGISTLTSTNVCSDSGDCEPYAVPFEGYSADTSKIKWGRAAAFAGATAITVGALHIYQMNAWWKDQRGPFHFVNDSYYAQNVDKTGHFFGGAFSAFLGKKSLEWSGFSRDASTIWGSTLGLMFELYIEFEDGFARNWGFSPGDALGDFVGAAWIVGMEYVPYMKNFQPKFSYFPSKSMLNGTHKGNMFDDYQGQTMWIGINVHGLLPEAAKPYWPAWLGIAVGAAVRGMETSTVPERSFIISLDYDFTKIIPGDSWFMQTLKEALNFIHFPAPAIRISPNFVTYGLYFQ